MLIFAFSLGLFLLYFVMSEYSKHVLSRWTVRRQVKRAVQSHLNDLNNYSGIDAVKNVGTSSKESVLPLTSDLNETSDDSSSAEANFFSPFFTNFDPS